MAGAHKTNQVMFTIQTSLRAGATYFNVQAGSISISSVAAGEVTLQGEKLKDAKHAEAVERVRGGFVHLVVESLGVWSPFGLKILKQIHVAARSTKHSALNANVTAKH